MSSKNRLALITGCTGGIGSAAARALAREGCSIAIHYASDSSKAKAEALIEEFTHIAQPDNIAIRASAFQADLSMYENAKKLYDEVVDTLGHPDIFFGNHGVLGKIIGPDGNVADVSPQIFEEIWRTNTGTNFYLAQLCIPHMEAQKWGRIILTSSVAALNGGLVGPHYASSKAAMHGLIHWLSLRYAKDGICSNAIAPALVEETTRLPRGTDEMRSRIPIGRLGKPDEIASIVVMLVKNAYMTNKVRATGSSSSNPEVIVADGGWTGGGI